MKILRYWADGRARVGVQEDEQVVDFSGEPWDLGDPGESRPIHSVTLLPPIHSGAKLICVGLNYRDHAAESGASIPTSPVLFAKFSNTLNAHGQPIRIPGAITSQPDYEAELGVVIGTAVSNVDLHQAKAAILGFTCVNDVSARDLQFADGQWVRGKSVDTFAPVGPAIVTADEIPDAQDLVVRCIVNGEVLQEASTSQMIFSVMELVSFISRTIRLEPGDLISTGTPAGVGFARTPPRFLTHGDTVVVDIGGVGRLENPVTVY